MSQPNTVRTRFAPSPTGYLHVGGARTALYNWLFARKNGGQFILRIEDTDKERNTEESLKIITEQLAWLGLDWDEGPNPSGANAEGEGDYGPYYQSQRDDIYDAYFQKLVDADRVYEKDGAWWFRFDRKPITFTDVICGEITIDYRNEDNTPDMVVKRSDGSYVFHFVNVVDDLTMKMTHVLRGEDHLMNTPKHLQLFEAFGEEPPIYGHIPLILNNDGSKMSKSSEGAATHLYAEKGFLPDAVVNYFALLGWSSKSDEEIFTIQELVERFNLEGINRSPSKFDMEKCLWMSQQHLMKLDAATLQEQAQPFLKAARLEEVNDTILTSIQEKVKTCGEIPAMIDFFYNDDFAYTTAAKDKLAKLDNAVELLNNLATELDQITDWSADAAKVAMKTVATAAGLKVGKIMLPCRIALSGMPGGPDMGIILEELGKEKCVTRLKEVASKA